MLDTRFASPTLPRRLLWTWLALLALSQVADLLTTDHPRIDTEAYRALGIDLDDGEILELSAAIVVASGWQRMIEAFGIRPDHWTEATPRPWID